MKTFCYMDIPNRFFDLEVEIIEEDYEDYIEDYDNVIFLEDYG